MTLSIAPGRFVSLIGPSGCGKSTIFNIVAGLLQPTGGRVFIDGVDATGTIGRVGYMLQKDLLLPWRKVLDNVILGMEIQGLPLREARERALPLLRRYGLAGFEYAYPELRCPAACASAPRCCARCCSTPTLSCSTSRSARSTRRPSCTCRNGCSALWADFGKTVVFVTHDVEEAIYLSDEVHVMATRPGRIVETIAVPIPRPRDRHATLDARFHRHQGTLPRTPGASITTRRSTRQPDMSPA